MSFVAFPNRIVTASAILPLRASFRADMKGPEAELAQGGFDSIRQSQSNVPCNVAARLEFGLPAQAIAEMLFAAVPGVELFDGFEARSGNVVYSPSQYVETRPIVDHCDFRLARRCEPE